MAKPVIINSSPLIFLSRSGNLPLLKLFGDEIWVPDLVLDEIYQKGEQDISVRAIKQANWLVAKSVSHIPLEIAEWRLGAGESAVLALAVEQDGEAILDDLAGRKCAVSMNIPVRGTLGIVLTAKQRGAIPEAKPVIESLLSSGLYLSRPVLEMALQRVGETL